MTHIIAIDEPMKEKCTYIEHLIKYRLRLPNKLASGYVIFGQPLRLCSAKIVVDGSEEFRRIVNNLPRNTPDLREKIGSTIRLIGPLWKVSSKFFSAICCVGGIITCYCQ